MWPFSKPKKSNVIHSDVPFRKQRPIDYEAIEAIAESDEFKAAMDKLPGGKPKKVIPGRADPRALDQIYGEGRIGGRKR